MELRQGAEGKYSCHYFIYGCGLKVPGLIQRLIFSIKHLQRWSLFHSEDLIVTIDATGLYWFAQRKIPPELFYKLAVRQIKRRMWHRKSNDFRNKIIIQTHVITPNCAADIPLNLPSPPECRHRPRHPWDHIKNPFTSLGVRFSPKYSIY